MTQQDRPSFFKYCPICNAETPQGSIACPNCGVNLEIARSNALKDVALAAGTYGYSIARQNNQFKLLNGFWYIVIGIITNAILYFSYSIIINFNINTGFWFVLSCAVFTIYFSAWGRYGEVSVYGFINMLVWSAIPVLNIAVFTYYFGKGMHIAITGIELSQHPTATKTGVVILAILLILGVITYTYEVYPLTSVYSPTSIRPTVTKQPIALTYQASGLKPSVINLSATPSCFSWYQITPAMNGQNVCVYGDVYALYTTDETWTRIKFTNQPNTFFIYSQLYVFPDLRIGNCIRAQGTVQLYQNIPYIETDDLYYCTP